MSIVRPSIEYSCTLIYVRVVERCCYVLGQQCTPSNVYNNGAAAEIGKAAHFMKFMNVALC